MKRSFVRFAWISAALLSAIGWVACEPKPSTSTSSAQPPATAPATDQPTASAAAPAPATVPVQPGGPAKGAVEASNRFGFELYDKLRVRAGNLAVSPASIALALSMTYGGARGDTATEMAKVMHLPADASALHGGWATVLSDWQQEAKRRDDRGPLVEISVANRLFGEKTYTFEKPFLTLVRDRYGAPLEQLDFRNKPEEQRAHINDWVKRQTRERIVDLIPPLGITGDTRLVLTNAIYLKAAWLEPFAEGMTKDDDFSTESGAKIKVPMMSASHSALWGETDDVELLELGYRDRRFAMLFVLPKPGKKLSDVEATLSDARLGQWLGALKPEQVDIAIPRFKIDPADSLELSGPLGALGMRLAFDRVKADFSGMAKPPSPADQLYIQKVFHKAFVAVDEAGTEAAAATAVVMAPKGAAPMPPPEPKVFRADRPFLFVLRDAKHGLVAFVGRVHDPRAKR